MLAVGRENLLPEDEDLRSMGDECIAYRLKTFQYIVCDARLLPLESRRASRP